VQSMKVADRMTARVHMPVVSNAARGSTLFNPRSTDGGELLSSCSA